MAEVIGLAASIIQIAGAGASLSKTLYNYVGSAACADQQIADIAGDVEITANALDSVGDVFRNEASSSIVSKKAANDANSLIKRCESVFAEIHSVIDKRRKPTTGGKKTLSAFGKLSWPLKEQKIQILRSRLESLKNSLILLFHVLQLANVQARGQIEQTALEKERDTIRQLYQRQQESLKALQALENKLDEVSLDDRNTLCGPESGTVTREPTINMMVHSSVPKLHKNVPREQIAVEDETADAELSSDESEISSSDSGLSDNEAEHLTIEDLSECAKHVRKLLKKLSALQHSLESAQPTSRPRRRGIHKLYRRFCHKFESNLASSAITRNRISKPLPVFSPLHRTPQVYLQQLSNLQSSSSPKGPGELDSGSASPVPLLPSEEQTAYPQTLEVDDLSTNNQTVTVPRESDLRCDTCGAILSGIRGYAEHKQQHLSQVSAGTNQTRLQDSLPALNTIGSKKIIRRGGLQTHPIDKKPSVIYGAWSPMYEPTSPGYSPTSPGYSPTSPMNGPTSPMDEPTSPMNGPTSPMDEPTSPMDEPTSPMDEPTSPVCSPINPTNESTSPVYSLINPKDVLPEADYIFSIPMPNGYPGSMMADNLLEAGDTLQNFDFDSFLHVSPENERMFESLEFSNDDTKERNPPSHDPMFSNFTDPPASVTYNTSTRDLSFNAAAPESPIPTSGYSGDTAFSTSLQYSSIPISEENSQSQLVRPSITDIQANINKAFNPGDDYTENVLKPELARRQKDAIESGIPPPKEDEVRAQILRDYQSSLQVIVCGDQTRTTRMSRMAEYGGSDNTTALSTTLAHNDPISLNPTNKPQALSYGNSVEEAPLFLNPKQFDRIVKRRMERQALEQRLEKGKQKRKMGVSVLDGGDDEDPEQSCNEHGVRFHLADPVRPCRSAAPTFGSGFERADFNAHQKNDLPIDKISEEQIRENYHRLISPDVAEAQERAQGLSSRLGVQHAGPLSPPSPTLHTMEASFPNDPLTTNLQTSAPEKQNDGYHECIIARPRACRRKIKGSILNMRSSDQSGVEKAAGVIAPLTFQDQEETDEVRRRSERPNLISHMRLHSQYIKRRTSTDDSDDNDLEYRPQKIRKEVHGSRGGDMKDGEDIVDVLLGQWTTVPITAPS